jgi:hypothetical protein
MVRYAVANTPYFCTLFNSHSLTLASRYKMKTDTIFYTLLQNLPSVLFELIEQPPTLALVLFNRL